MASEPEKSQISHLIRLIDDRDEFVRNRVRDQLIQLGEDAIPFLEIAVRTEKPAVKALAQEVIRAIFPKQLLGQFRQPVFGFLVAPDPPEPVPSSNHEIPFENPPVSSCGCCRSP